MDMDEQAAQHKGKQYSRNSNMYIYIAYRIYSNRSPRLVLEQYCKTLRLLLETWLVLETRLLLKPPVIPLSNCNFKVNFIAF